MAHANKGSSRENLIKNKKMEKLIYPCVWCNNNALEMANFYISVFPNTEIVDQNKWVVVLKMKSQRIMFLNGGDIFKPNPSISLMYLSSSEQEIESIFKKISSNGKKLMPLDSYPFSSKYAWVEDRYNVSWQLITASQDDIIQTVVPTLMFIGKNNGKAEEAIDFYTSVFANSHKRGISRYTGNEGETKGNIQHAEFIINNYLLMIMDSSYPHAFGFTGGVSIVVECKNQDEVDYYWSKLTSDGGEEDMCGWLRDKYGVSWQITPAIMKDILLKSPKVMEVMMTMKKLEIKPLIDAAN